MVLHRQGLVQQLLQPQCIDAIGGPVQLRQIAISRPEGIGSDQLGDPNRKIFLEYRQADLQNIDGPGCSRGQHQNTA
jgi:hypothetical protein